MIQKTYCFTDLDELQLVIESIHSETAYKTASGILMQLYNPRLDIDEDLLVQMVNDAFPEACIAGVTAANIGGDKFDISDYQLGLSVSFFQDTTLVQYDVDMNTITSFVAGRIMNESLDTLSDLKCLQIFYASNSTSITSFINEFRHHPVPMFGVKAGRNISRQNIAKVYGKKTYDNGFVVIAFQSSKLKLYMEANLGWQPIGIAMTITETQGTTVISQVDKKPAIDVYEKYLKVSPNQYFVENVCDFPMVIERNGVQIARVPAAYDDEGNIHLTSGVFTGDHFRLSYATEERLLALSEQSSKDLAKFNPEGVFLFECGNRLRFLGPDYPTEVLKYRDKFPELSLVAGYAELFITPDRIGADLNSTLVAIGLKEDSEGEDIFITCRDLEMEETVVTNTDREIPFIERILAFLECTSKELDSANKELGKIAYTDQLTKIYNRWELERKIDECLDLNRSGLSYGLLFFDIDHFKAINDNFGHDMGDRALLAVVDIIRTKLKDGHAFGRWGGEEFVYAYPAKDEKMLYDFAESIRKEVDDTCFVAVQHITISVGGTMARSDDTMLSFVNRADSGVYEAKETGRNKVVIK